MSPSTIGLKQVRNANEQSYDPAKVHTHTPRGASDEVGQPMIDVLRPR